MDRDVHAMDDYMIGGWGRSKDVGNYLKKEIERESYPFKHWLQASIVMQRLSYPTETVLSKEITRNRIVPSFKDSPKNH